MAIMVDLCEQNGDIIIGEGNAPAVSEAKQLALIRTSRVEPTRLPVPSLNASRLRLSTTVRRSPRSSFVSPSLPRLGSWAEGPNRSGQELPQVEVRALNRHLPSTIPLPTLLLLRTWRKTWEMLIGRPSASVGSASMDKVVREPRVAPTVSRQPLLPSRDVLPEPHVVTGKFNFPVTITDLTFLYLVSRGELKWTNDWQQLTRRNQAYTLGQISCTSPHAQSASEGHQKVPRTYCGQQLETLAYAIPR
jgi:hypothetical protein